MATESILHCLGVQGKGMVTSTKVPTPTQETWKAWIIPMQKVAVTPSNENVATADNSLMTRKAPTVLQGDLLKTPSVSIGEGSLLTMSTLVQNPPDQQNFAKQPKSMLAPQPIHMQGEQLGTSMNEILVSGYGLGQPWYISFSETLVKTVLHLSYSNNDRAL